MAIKYIGLTYSLTDMFDSYFLGVRSDTSIVTLPAITNVIYSTYAHNKEIVVYVKDIDLSGIATEYVLDSEMILKLDIANTIFLNGFLPDKCTVLSGIYNS